MSGPYEYYAQCNCFCGCSTMCGPSMVPLRGHVECQRCFDGECDELCPECDRRGYHRPGCSENPTAEELSAMADRQRKELADAKAEQCANAFKPLAEAIKLPESDPLKAFRTFDAFTELFQPSRGVQEYRKQFKGR
jgi:hypothetical protein